MPSLSISSNVNNNIPNVASNDIYLDSFGNISLSTNLQAVLENCAQAARTLLGEIVFNINQGIPYFQVVWIGVPNILQFSAALRLAFLAVSGVSEVVTLDTQQVDNSLTYTAVIKTVYGIGTLNG